MSVYFEKRVYRGTAFHLGQVTSSGRANEELIVRNDEFPSGADLIRHIIKRHRRSFAPSALECFPRGEGLVMGAERRQ